MTGSAEGLSPAILCRRVMRAADRATLATLAKKGKGGVGGPWPYTSLVLPACDYDVSPLLLISDLADHTRNLRQDPRVSLLYDGTGGLDEPLTGPRVGVQGEAESVESAPLLQRYLRRHPAAGIYAGFADFHLFRVRPVRAHLVAGFGRIDWIEAAVLVLEPPDWQALASAEADILGDLTKYCAELLDRCMRRATGERRGGWEPVALDPEGVDLRRGGKIARIDFASTVTKAEEVLAELRGYAGGD